MIVTEEEAKTKRCQESYAACSQVTPEGHTFAMAFSGGAYATATAPSMCIGSRCMAWRWRDSWVEDGRNAAQPNTKGYCGKAGEPS